MGITLDEDKKMSGKVALDHIYECDENGEPFRLAYAPGDPIPAEDLDAIEEEGHPLGDASLSGAALDDAIAEARGLKIQSGAEGGHVPVKTKDKRGPKDPPKDDDEGTDATDAAVKLAAENDIDMSALEGTGKDGRITHDDVAAAVAAKDSE